MEKEDCKDCNCLYECLGKYYCDDMGLEIEKFYECPNEDKCS